MRPLAQAWIAASRLRRRRSGWDNAAAARRREALIQRFVPGRSFLDVGCMWGADGRFSFLAEDAGAARVTGMDGMGPTGRYLAEHERRGSSMRFVQGDLHDPVVIDELGVHDVVFCNAVIYHTPNPFLLIAHLHRLTSDILLLGTHTIPEVPGLEQACVFYPGIGESSRRAYRRANPVGMQGISTPFDRSPYMGYANFWWGLTHSALLSMLDIAGFRVIEKYMANPFYADIVAQRIEHEPSVPPVELARMSRAAG